MGVKLIGFEKLEAKLTKNMDMSAVKTVVKKNGAEMQKKAMKEAPVLTHHLQKSIMLEITDGGMTAEVESTAEYAGYQEYGTRFMKGKPHIRPAFDEQKGKYGTYRFVTRAEKNRVNDLAMQIRKERGCETYVKEIGEY